MRAIMAAAVMLLIPSIANAIECPVGRGADIQSGVKGARVYAEPRETARVLGRLDGVGAVAVREPTPACRMPKGWARADHMGLSGYVREADLRPRVRFGMPE